MSNSTRRVTRAKSSKPSVPLVNSARSKESPPPTTEPNSSCAQPPANKKSAGNRTRPSKPPRLYVGQDSVKPVTIGCRSATVRDRPTSMISFGSIINDLPEIPPPRAKTPPPFSSTSTLKPKKTLNLHALFQGGGGVPTIQSTAAPQSLGQARSSSSPTGRNAPRSPGSVRGGAVSSPRSPQIPHPPLAGVAPPLPHPPHPPHPPYPLHPLQYHPQHPPPMQPPWCQPGYYYPPQGYIPNIHPHNQHYPHPSHPHPHPHPYPYMPPHMHNPPIQPPLHLSSNQPHSPTTSCPSTSSPASISMDLRTPSTTSTSSSATDDQLSTTLAAMYVLDGGREDSPRAKQECEKRKDNERQGREAKEKGVEDTERRERGKERIKQQGHLFQLGELSKSAGLLFGLTRALDQEDSKPCYTTRPRANSSIAMFAVPDATGADSPPQADGRGGARNRNSVDPGPDGSLPLEGEGTREQLNLSPRVKPTETEVKKDKDGGVSRSAAAPVLMSDAKAREKVKKVVKAYLDTENLEETIVTLETLPIEYRYIFVDAMAVAALDGDDKLVALVENLFTTARERCVCSAEAFERGLFPVVEMSNDISTGVPKAYEWLARLMRAAGVKRIQVKKMAAKIVVRGEVWVHPKDLLMQEFDKAILEAKEREERERREKEEKEEVEREARERAEREAREKEELERLAREEKERVAKEQEEATATAEEEARFKAEAEVTATAVAAERSPQAHDSLFSGQQSHKDPARSELSTSDESWERNNLAQHDPSERLEDAGLAEECIQTYLSAGDIGQAIDIFQKMLEGDRAAFVGKCIAAAFDGGSESVLAMQQLFNAAYNGRICTAKSFEQGFLIAVDSADETSMDVPRTYEWLARLMHGAGLTKARVERMAENIMVVGEPRLEPKYLLVYEFEKLVS